MSSSLLDNLSSPILLHGNERTAYRDPCAVYDAGRFALYFTLVETGDDGLPWLFTAMSESTDLKTWSAPQKLTPQDRARNYSSPGSILRQEGEWVMCLQTYPRQSGEKYANESARLWTMRSTDLREWSKPELMRVKGPDVPDEGMGRMIDPYLVADKNDPGLFWCLFKQNGASRSSSRDLRQWDYQGHFAAGENVCVIADEEGYWLFHSPENGIGLKRSADLAAWEDIALFTLGQADWPWAQGRLTAGFVLDCRAVPGVGKYVMFFHGTGPDDESVIFDTHACIGIAWSDDLLHWRWPGDQK